MTRYGEPERGTLQNTIVAANAPVNCFAKMIDGGHDISFPETSCPGANVDPRLGPLAANGGPTLTQALLPGSPAIDAVPATGAGCPATDQRGVSRPQGPACDIGAFEVAVPAPPAGGGAGNVPGPGPVAHLASLTRLSETYATFALAPVATPLSAVTAARRHHRGTVFSFSLDQAATVRIAIAALTPGRRVGSRCVHDSHKLRHKPRCTRAVAAGTLMRAAHAGKNRVAFSGRIGSRALRPGRYSASFTAIDAAGASSRQTLTFTIVAR
jgi:hypothetical protein